MKLLIATFVLSVLFSCESDKKATYDLKHFNMFLGEEKSKALDEAVESFDKYLRINFPDEETFDDQARAFLTYINKYSNINPSWSLDSNKATELYYNLENSGMRKEIALYVYEYRDYEATCNITELLYPEMLSELRINNIGIEEEEFILEEEMMPINFKDSTERIEFEQRESERDSFIETNIYGEFLYGLIKYSKNDTCIQNYAEAYYLSGNFSWNILSNVYLEYFPNLDNEFYKRMLIADFYIYIINQ